MRKSLFTFVVCATLPALAVVCWFASPSKRAASLLSEKARARSAFDISTSPMKSNVDPADLDALCKLACTDATAARAAATRLGSEAVVAVAIALAKTDLAATESWARSLKDPLHDAALSALVVEVASENQNDALRLARQLDDFDKRQQMMAYALAQLAATDPQAAWDALQKAAIPAERIALERIVLAAVAEHDPESVAQWLTCSRVPTDLVQSLTVSVAQRWIQKDPFTAATWVVTLSDEMLRRQAAEAIMQIWSSQDAASAELWLKSQPTGDARDEMAVALGSALAARDGDAARQLSTTIHNETLRNRLLSRINSQPEPPIVDNGHAAGEAGGCYAE